MYFGNFSRVWYDLQDKKQFELVTNILQRVGFRSRLKDEGDFFIEYNVKDTDKPEIIADKIYGDPNFHWIVLLFNDFINPTYEWIKSPQNMSNLLSHKYKGNVLYLESSDFSFGPSDRVSIDRWDPDGPAWEHIGTDLVLSTDRSLHKVVLSGEAPYVLGDYVTLDGIELPQDPNNEEAPVGYRSVNPNTPAVTAQLTNNKSSAVPDWATKKMCHSCYDINVRITSEDDVICPNPLNPNCPNDAPVCQVRIELRVNEWSRCLDTIGDTPIKPSIERYPTIKDPIDFRRCYLNTHIRVCTWLGACDCDDTKYENEAESDFLYAFDPCIEDCGIASEAYQLFNRVIEEMFGVATTPQCCQTQHERAASFKFVNKDYNLKENEHMWFGISKEELVQAMYDSWSGVLTTTTHDTDMKTEDEIYVLHNYTLPPSELTVAPLEILKIVLVPEKGIHHLEDGDGNTLNPLANLDGEVWTGTVNAPISIPFENSLLYMYTQDNQIFDSDIINVVSDEELLNFLDPNILTLLCKKSKTF
jgi:hypothetical protein